MRSLNRYTSLLCPWVNDFVRRLQHFGGTNPHFLAKKRADSSRHDDQEFGSYRTVRCGFGNRQCRDLSRSGPVEAGDKIGEDLRLIRQLLL